MRNALRLAVFACMSLCVCVLAHAQVGPPTTIIPTPTAPTGSCTSTSIRLLTPNGTLYTCNTGTWAAVAGGGGGGTPTGPTKSVQTNGGGGTFGNTGAVTNNAVVVTDGSGNPSESITLPSGLNLGTPLTLTLTNATGLPISTGVSGLGTGVATALGVNTGTAGAFVVNGGALGTPSSGVATNLTGTAAGLSIGGNAATATALAANGTNCSAGNAAQGVDASGNAEGCFGVAPALVTATTYYVCSKANGSTCASTDTGNGWNGNVTASPTISDANNCTAVATPCRTVAGVQAKIGNGQLSSGVIPTVYVADNANTGTDCLADVNLVWTNEAPNHQTQTLSETSATSLTFPSAYVYLYGNPTTPTNVTLAGNGCGQTTLSTTNTNGWYFQKGVYRINGFRVEGYGRATTELSFGGEIIVGDGATLYADNITCTGPGSVPSASTACLMATGSGTVMRTGGTHTATGTFTAHFASYNNAVLYTFDGLANSSTNTVVSDTNPHFIWSANEGGTIYRDHVTYSALGTADANSAVLRAYLGGRIINTEAFKSSECPSGFCLNGTLNAASLNAYQDAQEGGFIDDDCLNYNEGQCTVTQQPTFHSVVSTLNGRVRVYESGGSSTKVITSTDNILQGGQVCHFTSGGSPTESCNFFTLSIGNGGTNGTATPTAGALAYGNGSAYAFSSAGTTKQVALSGGTGTPTFITFPDFHYSPAANCTGATPTAGAGWNTTAATPTPTCRAGTNNKDGYLSWGATDVGYFELALPNDWDATTIDLSLNVSSSDATNNHTIIMQVSTGCQKADGSTTDDVAFNTAQSLSTVTLNGNANRSWQATLSTLTITGCAAGSLARFKVSRTTDTATDVKVWGAGITLGRLLTLQAN